MGNTSVLRADFPMKGLRAAFVEIEFLVDGVPCPLTTQLRILDAKK